MERDTLIKVFALLLIAAFILEMFSIRSSTTNPPSTPSEGGDNQTVYGAGEATATLVSYTDYLNVFESGGDISGNSSLNELNSIDGVGYINRQGGTVTLVLEHGANISFVAGMVRERFPNLNVTANAVFSLPSQVEFSTPLGNRNVSIGELLAIEIEPDIDIGDNVTLSLVGLLAEDRLQESPVAKIIPTKNEAIASALISEVGDRYSAVIMLPWGRRNVNVSRVEEELSKEIADASVNYTPNSFVAVKGLDSRADDIKKIENLSYVSEVSGDLVYVTDDFNNSGEIESELRGILGNNATVEYPISSMSISFSSANFSRESLLKPVGGELVLYRQTFLKLSGRIEIAGRQYGVPSNTTFEVTLLDSYSVGQNISVVLKTGTIGRRIVSLELKNIVG